jgi:hypothetical protein
MMGTIFAETTASGPFLLSMSRMVATKTVRQDSGLSRITDSCEEE